MTLWRVTGEAATDSSGGVETWLYLTPDSIRLPDVLTPLRPRGGGERTWYHIARIECLGELRVVIDPTSELGRDLVADVTLP
jgi:hypothetical protein